MTSLHKPLVFIACCLVMCMQHAQAQNFPAKPIRLIVPLAPGGNADMLARTVGQRMSETWGKPVVVDNRPGGSGVIAAEIVAKSAPDGYTLLIAGPAQVAINPSLFKSLPYDAEKDFSAVSLGITSPMILVAHHTFAPRTVGELIALAKAKPGKLAYASVGVASPQHLAGELFKMISGAGMVHIPYKGGGPATAALLGGQEAQLGFLGISPVLPHVKAGRLNALGVSTADRSPALPQVPTLEEQGVTGFRIATWSAFVAPARTPTTVIAKLNAEVVRVLKLPDVKSQLSNAGLDPAPTSPEALAQFIKAEAQQYRKIIRAADVRPE